MGTRATAWSCQFLGGTNRRLAGRLVGFLAVVLVAVPATASAEPEIFHYAQAWRGQVRLNTQPPFARPTPITGTSCPIPEFCIAVDGSGDVLTSVEPTGGVGAWSIDSVDAEGGFTDLSCPSMELCFATDDAGNVFDWSEPASRDFTWTELRVDEWTPLESISCPSSRLCVAGDAEGNLIVSTNPSALPSHWQSIDPDFAHSTPIRSVSCPTVNACVAVSEGGQIFASTSPTFDESWTATTPAGSHSLFDVSCVDESSCVVSGDSGDILTSSDPFANGATWSPAHVGTGSLEHVECTPAGLCVASAPGGIVTSTEPAGGAGAWDSTPLDLPDGSGGQTQITSVACGGSDLCLLGDGASGMLTSTAPGGGKGAWTSIALSVGASTPQGIACKASFRCIAVDDAGNLYTLDSGQWLPSSVWQQKHVDAHPLTAVACGSACIAVDDAGGVLTASGPYWDSTTVWSHGDIDGGVPLTGASCGRNSPFCAVIDQEGNVLATRDPNREDFEWTKTHLSDDALDGISCPFDELCVATDDGSVLVSTEPLGGAGAWTKTYVNAGRSISCTEAELCVTVREDGGIVVSTEPAAGVVAWTETLDTRVNGLDEVACPNMWGPMLCAATTYGGNGSLGTVLESQDPASGHWVRNNVYNAPIVRPDPTVDLHTKDLTGVACAGGDMCAVVDTHGTAIVSEIPKAPPPGVGLEPPKAQSLVSAGEAHATARGTRSAAAEATGAFQITRAHVSDDGKILLSVHAPAAGSLTVRAQVNGATRRRQTYRAASAAARGPGTIRLALAPRRPLSSLRRLRVRIVVAYQPENGGRLTERKSLPIG